MANWFEFKAFADIKKIYIHDDIGKNGVTAKAFREELEKFSGPIDVHIDSAGGVVTEGISIYNTLKAYKGQKTIYIDSLAASMASVIAMAGDYIHMADNGLLMLHNPWGTSVGDSREMRKTANVLDKMKTAMINAYQEKSSIDREQLESILDDETWLNGEEALALGLIDNVTSSNATASINDRKQVFAQSKIDMYQHAAETSTVDIRESANKIITARKSAPSNNIFKSQNRTPSNYIGITK